VKVGIYTPEVNPGDDVLTIKAINFTEPRREMIRDHIKFENNAKLVWFEDESPPQEVVDAILKTVEEN
jgi:hypothetical protein